MLFSSLIFLFAFLPIVLVLYYTVFRKSIRLQNLLLLIASIFFYAWGEPKFVFVMMASIIMNYTWAILVDRYEYKKRTIFLAVATNLGLLFVFKYLNFTVSNIDHFFGNIFPQTDIALPIGISFFTFQAMSYVIDVYRGDTKVQRNILYVALYISFFPQLIAGPIVRYTDIESKLETRKVSFDDFTVGTKKFLIGLSKKVIIANNLAIITDAAFDSIEGGYLSLCFAWLGAITYALQIYFDFDGYSEMAIGLGKMFGFHFPENFIYPYRSKSIHEFWKYNHISLCTWFRDYVYIPLGGSRRGKLVWMRNMFIVWALTGIWHGASWTFLIWGLAYFVLLVIEKELKIPECFKRGGFLYRAFTLVCLFVLNGVFFRDIGAENTTRYLISMFSLKGGLFDNLAMQYILEYKVIIVVAIIYAFAGFYLLRKSLSHSKLNSLVEIISPIVYIALFFVSISYLAIGAYNPFIYFNF